MESRRVILILAEARRRRSMARLDTARRAEHLEVAAALEWAARRLAAAARGRGRGRPINKK